MILKNIYKGETLYRALSNHEMKNIVLTGSGIDLGAKSQNASYYKYIDFKAAKIQFADLFPDNEDFLQVDLEKDFEIQDESQDFVLLMNVIEHIYNYKNCIRECYRILKPDCNLYGVVPFLHKYHADPEDYHRLTQSALKKTFELSGFKKIEITVLGYGQFTAAYSQLYTSLYRLRIFRVIGAFFAISFDKIFNYILKQNKKRKLQQSDFALGYYFKVTK
jgi:ubiquinone/menaquinone biosynthesis C-methylase UbiE